MNEILLENDIVLLRPVELTDIEAITEAGTDPRIWEHLSFDLRSKEAVESYVQKAIEERKAGISYVFAVIEKKSQKLVGCTSYMDISIPHKRMEIGSTWLTPAVWRTVINTNNKFLLLQYGFEQMELNRIQIKTGHENFRSQKAIERLGATKEGILRNHMIRKEGTIRHTVMYSIIKEEWPKIKKHFIENLL